VRDTIAAEFLKTAGNVGQIAIEHADITRPETLAGKFAGSVAVINLVSILYESGRQKFAAINVAGARAIATEAKKAGASRFIQISALGADRSGDTKYGATKIAGEQAVLEAFPGATILRPSLIIGPEDGFFQRFGRMSLISPVLPLIAGGRTRFQPVLVTDVARAILAALGHESARGKTYELAGPRVYTFRELLELLATATKRSPLLVNIPAGIAKVKGLLCELSPFPPIITRDQVRLLAHDNVLSEHSLTFQHLGIEPMPIVDALPTYLARFVKE
jgi:NADH dehydrogenase